MNWIPVKLLRPKKEVRRTKILRVKPEFPVSFMFSNKTRAFLTRDAARKFEHDLEFVAEHHENLKPLTTPSGVTLTAPSSFGKAQQLHVHYAEQSGFFIKSLPSELFEREMRLRRAIVSKGVPVEKIVFSYKEPKAGLVHYLAEKTGPSLVQALEAGKYGSRDFARYFSTLSAFHSLGWRHNHPHLGNFFEHPSGRVGIFDFSLAQKVGVNWAVPESIFLSFYPEYRHVLEIYARGATNKDEMFEKLASRKVGPLLEKLAEHLPVTPPVKQKLVAQLHSLLYDEVIPFLRSGGYFEHKRRIL